MENTCINRAYKLYLYTGYYSSWNDGGAVFQVYTNSDIDFTSLGNNWYSAEVNSFSGTAYIKRCNPDGKGKWNEFSASISSTNNVVRATGWNSGQLFSMYISGDNWNNIGSWQTSNANGKMAITSENTFSKSFTNVAASAHKCKIVEQGTWDRGRNWNSGTVNGVNCAVQDDGSNDHNIQFTPYIATGTTTISYNVSTGVITITCPDIPITFNKQSGTGGSNSVTATYGSAMPDATMPTREGYSFDGYYTEASGGGTKIYDYDGSSLVNCSFKAATTLYANWKQKTTVTMYYAAPADVVACNTVKCYYNCGYGQTGNVAMTKTDYTYDGKLIYSIQVTANYENIEDLYFKPKGDNTEEQQHACSSWTPASTYNNRMYVHGSGWADYSKDASYTVYFVNNSSWSTPKAYAWNSDCDKNAEYSTSGTMTNTDKTYNGKQIWSITFNKCYANIIFNSNGSTSSKTGNLTLGSTNAGKLFTFASSTTDWVAYTYDVAVTLHDNNGGSHNGSANVHYKSGTSFVSSTAPTKTGYTVEGYYKEVGTTTKIATAAGALQANTSYTNSSRQWSSGAQTLYTKWTANQYTITFDKQSGSGGTSSATVHYDNNDFSVSPVVCPTRTGYNFGGYFTATNGDGVQIVNASGVWQSDKTNYLDASGNWIKAENTKLYAKWTAKQSEITYNQSGTGYGSGGQTTHLTATYGQAMPTPISTPTAANGYAFMGYYDAANGGGTQYYTAAGASARNWNKDTNDGTNLYAYFKKAEITGFTGGGNVEKETPVTITPTIAPTPVGSIFVCWRLLYSDGTEVAHQPAFTWNGTSVTFTAPEAGGNYKVEAKLRSGTTCDGTLLDTKTVDLIVAGSYNVTIQYKRDDVTIKPSTIEVVHSTTPTEITAPDVVGYSFSSWTLGEGITLVSGTTSSPTISVTAIYAGTITANYTKKRMIYFKNTLGWSGVTVYFYKNASYWNNDWGTGANTTYTYTDTPYSDGKHGDMTNIAGTDIWYFDLDANNVPANLTTVNFTELNQHGYGYFDKTGAVENKVAHPCDHSATYNPNVAMYVPIDEASRLSQAKATYYFRGYWMNYPENTGYTLKIYNSWNADIATGASREYVFPYGTGFEMPIKLDVEFNTSGQYWFMVYRHDGTYWGAENAVMTQDSHSEFRIYQTNHKPKIITSSPGVYTYTLSFFDDGEGGYMYHINVDYPVSVGDYRIIYKDNDTWSNGAHGNNYATWYHPSDVINKISGEATEAKLDTVSFFVSYGKSPAMKFQYVSAIDAGTGAVTWSDVPSGSITIPSSVTKKGVYNFIVSQPVGGSGISLVKAEPYTGNFYIRTDCAGSTKWDNYRSSDHLMTYSSYAEAHSSDNYSHYFVKFVAANTNIKYTIANDYSVAITDSLVGDPVSEGPVIDGGGKMTAPATGTNIRFMWDQRTNKLSRAYITGPISNEYLYLRCLTSNANVYRTWTNPSSYSRLTSVSKTEGGNAYTVDTLVFNDMQNWIYQADLYAKPGATYKLTANVNGTMTFFRGKEGTYSSTNVDELIGGNSGTTAYHIRLVYDFKNDRMVTAWMPSGQIDENLDINADVMIIREHQDAAQQITFGTDKSMSDVKTVYGAIRFNRWILDNRSTTGEHSALPIEQQKSIYERSLYFISFPFNVKVNEIFGFGKYWDEWYIEYYDGLTRAKNGYWADSPSNWKYVTTEMAKTYTLEANKGYILGLDLDFMGSENTDFWSNGIEYVSLYFPSAEPVGNIESTTAQQPALSEEYYCSINRGTPDGDRRVKDSYWRCIGVPSYANYSSTLVDGSGNTITWTTGTTLPYLYEWRLQDNELLAQSTSNYNFKAMHSYLVQYAGVINWTAVSAKPSPVIRRSVYGDSEYNWRLTLVRDEHVEDQTFIRLRDDEMITDGFDFDQDLSKEFNKKGNNIYTYIGYEKVAANSMPINSENTLVVPAGLNINQAGDYTISIPDGTNGVEVQLLDAEAGIRTNLSAGLDYSVTLEKGDYTDRFFIEISPITQVDPITTSISETEAGTKEPIRKVLINGVLYIVKDGKVFDARGARLQ